MQLIKANLYCMILFPEVLVEGPDGFEVVTLYPIQLKPELKKTRQVSDQLQGLSKVISKRIIKKRNGMDRTSQFKSG